MIIGTAGHIDHGKTALLQALTGAPLDPLREEKERGITMDLHFTSLDLGTGVRAGIVDVPGHEDLVRTMVAGASGMDLVLLLVAADSGIMPQTREHLAIAEQLRIPRGIPVISRADLVEPEWCELVAQEVAEWLHQSSVRFTDVMITSSRTGQGLDRLREELRREAGEIARREPGDLFRLPVDRRFSVAGAGTVVTGTAWSGSVREGDAVRVMPAGHRARVRSIEVHGTPVTHSEPGQRLALALAGIDREEIVRGDMVVHESAPWRETRVLDAEVEVGRDAARAIGGHTRLRIHLGTGEYIGRFRSGTLITPGTRGFGRITLDRPVVARGGDRFVIRDLSPVRTLGGGLVLDPAPPARSPVAHWASRGDTPHLRPLLERRPAGISLLELPLLLGTAPDRCGQIVREEPAARVVGERVILGGQVEEAMTRIKLLLGAFHRDHPERPGIALAELRQTLRGAPWTVGAALDDLVAGGVITVESGQVHLTAFRPREPGPGRLDQLVARIDRAGLTPPAIPELDPDREPGEILRLLRLAAADGRLVAVETDRFYARPAIDRFVQALAELADAGLLTPARIRDHLGITRKYLIPLLEWADREGITAREEGGRRMRSLPRSPAQP